MMTMENITADTQEHTLFVRLIRENRVEDVSNRGRCLFVNLVKWSRKGMEVQLADNRGHKTEERIISAEFLWNRLMESDYWEDNTPVLVSTTEGLKYQDVVSLIDVLHGTGLDQIYLVLPDRKKT